MTLPRLGDLAWVPALERPDLLAPATHAALVAWADTEPRVADEVAVAAIDPDLSDTQALTEAYGLPLEASVNCVLVGGRREGVERVVALGVRAHTRADVNGVVKRLLDVRKASFLPRERAVSDSGMEYGGITPIGVPAAWDVLLDPRAAQGPALVGSGLRASKVLLPGDLLALLPGARVVDGLASA